MATTYVNVGEMSRVLEEMLGTINALNGHIESYNTDASKSLGESSFRPTIESNLEGIKAEYQAMVPELEKIKTKIEEIKNEYVSRAGKIEGTGQQGSTTMSAPRRTRSVEQSQ